MSTKPGAPGKPPKPLTVRLLKGQRHVSKGFKNIRKSKPNKKVNEDQDWTAWEASQAKDCKLPKRPARCHKKVDNHPEINQHL